MAKDKTPDTARLKAKQMREEQLRKERRMRNIIILVVGVIVIAIVAVFVAVLASNKNTAGGTQSGASSAQESRQLLGSYADGAPVVFSHLGVGKADPDLPTLTEYFDYTCPHCAEATEGMGDTLVKAAEDGKFNIQYQMVDTQRRFYSYAEPAGTASLIVAQKDPEHWQAFHHALFDKYTEEVAKGDQSQIAPGMQAQSFALVKQVAQQVGVPQDVINTFVPDAVEQYLTAANTTWGAESFNAGQQYGTPQFVKDGASVLPMNGNTWPDIANSLVQQMTAK